MGWTGTVILGAVVGFFGWWLHPLRRGIRGEGGVRRGLLRGVIAGVAGAVLANAAGRLTGAFFDGELLQWPVTTAIALVAAAVVTGASLRH
jgi:uncharacterized membrane protein YeaQ/YmgE (transglycosylase-associated protein family)